MRRAPGISESCEEERRAWVDARYPCIADCDACGLCTLFHGHDASYALADYISGRLEYTEVMARYRRG